MSKLNHTEQQVAQKTVCVLLVRGDNPDGGGIYAYVAVRADKLEDFMEAQRSGTFYPEDYGVIIESGEGEPSAEVRARMEQDYGFNHESMVDIPDADNAGDLAHRIVSSPDVQASAQEEGEG